MCPALGGVQGKRQLERTKTGYISEIKDSRALAKIQEVSENGVSACRMSNPVMYCNNMRARMSYPS